MGLYDLLNLEQYQQSLQRTEADIAEDPLECIWAVIQKLIEAKLVSTFTACWDKIYALHRYLT